jgi:FKBP-type peptidyl-prolyl cis-trans isomerase 2
VDFVAGEDILKSPRGGGGSFETEVIARLAEHVMGMKKGEQKTVELAAPRRQSSNPAESILEVAKVRRRAKEVRMTVDEFKQRKGADPVVGQDYTVDPTFRGKVTQVTETEVVVLNAPPPEMQVETPFGRGKVVDSGKHYLVEIDARVGTLVRSGGMVGRIVEVGEGERGMITLDYSHPFGGEVLDCELTLVDFDPPKDPQ